MHSPSRLTRFLFGFALTGLSLPMLACSLTVTLDTSTPTRPAVVVNNLRATFLGQDGANFAGQLCTAGTANDNVHIHLDGLRTDTQPARFRVDEPAQGGVWATPCDPLSNWLLHVTDVSDGTADLYFKPFRDAPDGTEYLITVQYADGQIQTASVTGRRVKP